MKTLIILFALAAIAFARPEEYYSTQYDDFDVDELVNNVRLLKNYGKCFLNQGPCTPEGNDFKKVIPDAVKTKCVKCSPKQKVLIRKVVRGFQEELPEIWSELVQQEDPKGLYKTEFENFLNGTD
uniref:Chemosensory protein n=1 Tax=Dendrolimus kikuchii TaxID=765133 RepID=A0A076E970_9NEOP|nr:chemosensory protein [Dendrolimus kikuchii]